MFWFWNCQNMDAVNDNSIVLDAGSTKSLICKVVEKSSRKAKFLGLSPIAGTESFQDLRLL